VHEESEVPVASLDRKERLGLTVKMVTKDPKVASVPKVSKASQDLRVTQGRQDQWALRVPPDLKGNVARQVVQGWQALWVP
jgi:hypothetical protein